MLLVYPNLTKLKPVMLVMMEIACAPIIFKLVNSHAILLAYKLKLQDIP